MIKRALWPAPAAVFAVALASGLVCADAWLLVSPPGASIGAPAPDPLAPVARVKTTPATPTGTQTLAVSFDGTASTEPSGTPLAFLWDFGDGSAQILAALATHTYGPGTFSASLTVTNQNGVSDLQSVSIQVSPAATTLIPVSVGSVLVYPNPWRAGKHDGKPITFSNLPGKVTIKIFTTSGHLVKTLSSASAKVPWDLTNDNGDLSASGIYLYMITDGQGNKTRGKVAIIR